MNRFIKLTTIIGLGLLGNQALADTISINRMDVHDLKQRYFQLEHKQKVEVTYIAPKYYRDNDNDSRHDFVWIVDLDSRETVWRSRNSEVVDDASNDKLAVFGDDIRLDKGRYGIYYSTHNFRTHTTNGIDVFLYGLSSLLRDSNRITHNDIDEFYADLRGKNLVELDSDEGFKPFGETKELASIRKVRKSRFKQFGLDVTKDSTLSIYAVGELSGNHQNDYAWLKDATSGETIWQMDKKSSEHAGGARKNRSFKGEVAITKGTYILGYASDNSHHYNDWNSRPPYDPAAWGVSIFGDEKAINVFDLKARRQAQTIAAITKVGDNASIQKHFTLSKPTKVRVVALGERASRSSMADHGWIEDNKSGKTLWQMKTRKTSHAGGSRKNRISDQVIKLPAGSYTLQYVSDDSHSYGDGWNASKPHDETRWGISLYGIDQDFDKSSITIDTKPQNGALAKITAVGDSKRLNATFELSADQAVRIYAIGEGDDDEMFDYGYIKNMETGRRVWNMFADETKHAGGARKNRQVDQVIKLEKGKYKVYFRTDGSHSYNDWNARPPTDEKNYGITVFDASK